MVFYIGIIRGIEHTNDDDDNWLVCISFKFTTHYTHVHMSWSLMYFDTQTMRDQAELPQNEKFKLEK